MSISFKSFPSMAAIVLACLIIFTAISSTVASDPDPLQDICVADLSSEITVNGFVCKNDAHVTAADFTFAGLANPGIINNSFGSIVTAANVQQIPGLNTLGVSLARIDYAPGGLNPPHTHPRATETIFVLFGELEVAFITTANKLISTTIKKGEIYVFPRGLVHFQKNNGDKPAAVISGFNSQLPGVQVIPTTLFAATPPVSDDVLEITFQVDEKVIDEIKANFAPKKKV